MLSPQDFYNLCTEQGIDFFTGVPDSLLKDFCSYLTDHVPDNQHVIAANEGGAVALAAGHYLATGNLGLVYMQNSGQGNAVNPLMSMADPEVYGIPMLLLVGWRGEPGIHDEPQHVKQGRITKSLFDAIEIPYEVLAGDYADASAQVERLCSLANKNKQPVALIVQKGIFDKYSLIKQAENHYKLTREETIKQIASSMSEDSVFIGSTGHISRELYEYRLQQSQGHERDFLTVGSMGHASQIALGIAMSKPERTVCCLDGDGAVLLHMGTMALIGQSCCGNFCHFVLNNGAHGSVGGQPTVGFSVSLKDVASACGYKFVQSVKTLEELKNALSMLEGKEGPSFLEVKVSSSVRKDLGRPTESPTENKKIFMEFLKS